MYAGKQGNVYNNNISTQQQQQQQQSTTKISTTKISSTTTTAINNNQQQQYQQQQHQQRQNMLFIPCKEITILSPSIVYAPWQKEIFWNFRVSDCSRFCPAILLNIRILNGKKIVHIFSYFRKKLSHRLKRHLNPTTKMLVQKYRYRYFFRLLIFIC